MCKKPTSVIICTHNRAELLPRIVGELRAQDYPRDAFEIIVVDHRSTDDTASVVHRLVTEQGAPVRYVAESRPGVTCARNCGAQEARYPYLAFIDDDCTVAPDWLERLVSGFDLDTRVVAVGGQILVHWDQPRPPWLGPDLERWLAVNGYLGSHRRLLESREHIVEGNLVLDRNAWEAAGGFLGMEQFGSRDMAAGEVIYLLNQLQRRGGKIAFVPQAIAYHHVGTRTKRGMLQRAFWQGVSDAVLDRLLYDRTWASVAYRTSLDLMALVVLLVFATGSHLIQGSAKGMYQLARASRRMGLLLAAFRFVGDWGQVQSWLLEHRVVWSEQEIPV